VVVVVDGVMSIQGDVSSVHKAKDHNHEYSHWVVIGHLIKEELARDGEPDALKDACPVRERLH